MEHSARLDSTEGGERAARGEEQRALIVEEFAGSAEEWDGCVAGWSGATFCHLWSWRSIMTDVLKHECRYLAARDDSGACVGVLPLVRVRSRLFGHYLVSMPFLNYGGPLGAAEAQRLLVERALDVARHLEVDLLELRTREPSTSDLRFSQRKITVLLPLPTSPDELWSAFPSKLRSQIRRPQKEGMGVRFGADQVDAFYEVFCNRMRDLGTPVLPQEFFERIASELREEVDIAVVYDGERPVASGWGFVWGDEFELTWASSLAEYNKSAPNMLLYWSLMERMCQRGLSVFNFGRCTPGGGTHRFKKQWGGEDQPLPWAQWSPREIGATPSPESPGYRLATAVWRRIPLTVANRLGPLLARRIP